jgi:hypothetical protein
MKLVDATKWLSVLTSTHPLESITIHGGEPVLYRPLLESVLKVATELQVPRRGIITNGFWAQTKRTAHRILTALKHSGLTSITFSVDGFHQEFIPLEYIRIGLQEAVSLNFTKVSVLSHFLSSVDADNQYNKHTTQLLMALEDIQGVQTNRFVLSLYGRAADTLAGLVEKKEELPTGPCSLPYWLGGNLHNPKAIEIDSEGNITLCPGICIGNLQTQPMADLVEDYSPDKHPILKILDRDGPIGLSKILARLGIEINGSFVDECHLCYQMRRLLQEYYPLKLAPRSCY